MDFLPGVIKKIFPEGVKSGEISFYPLENKKTTFFAKKENYKFQNPGGFVTPSPPSDTHKHRALSSGYRKGKAFCERPFVLHRQQFEKDKQNVDVSPCKNFCGRPCQNSETGCFAV